MALNHISIMGRFTKDPEIRYTQSGKAVASFTVAVDRDFGEGVDFIDCVAWEKKAEFVNKYFEKGKSAIVAGSLQMRDWTDKNGNKRVAAEVIASNVYFAESKKNEQGYDNAPKRDINELSKFPGTRFKDAEDDDGDLPF